MTINLYLNLKMNQNKCITYIDKFKYSYACGCVFSIYVGFVMNEQGVETPPKERNTREGKRENKSPQ